MGRPVIKARDLAKRYRIGTPDSYLTLRESLSDVLHRLRRPLSRMGRNEQSAFIWALDGVSFGVEEGEVVGIIGANGAGKSTLLKILSRVTYPTRGSAELSGRVASLLEVGTGFHPELTGRENIFLSGAVLGMRRSEIRNRLDAIVEFSGVERFLDTPVKRYSSGMYLRLAFAIAAHVRAEILLVDEVLAVGDAAFQRKCLGNLDHAATEGRTILLVSHNLTAIAHHCARALLIEKGRIALEGAPSEVIAAYQEGIAERGSGDLTHRLDRKGEGSVRFTDITILDPAGKPVDSVKSGDDIVFVMGYESSQLQHSVVFAIAIYSSAGAPLFLCRSDHASLEATLAIGPGRLSCTVPSLALAEGNYSVNVAIQVGSTMCDWIGGALTFHVDTVDFFGNGSQVPLGHSPFLVKSRWTLM